VILAELLLSLAASAAPPAQIVEAPIPGTPSIAVRVLFYSGSADDPPGKEGLTRLCAHLMAEGGTKSMTYAELLKQLYPLAAEIEVKVEKEEAVFYANIHPDHVARFVPILAQVIKEPRFAEADFTRIKQDMINDIEKRLRATDDENFGKELLSSMIYDHGHPYGHFTGGTVEGIKAITLDDVRAHAAKVFGKKRMVIGIGGAFDAKAKESLAAALADVPEGEPRIASIPKPQKPSRTEVIIAEKPGKAIAISIGFAHDQHRGTPDFYDLGLVQSYFGEHRQFHGVLMSEMREKRGLNYGDYAYMEKFIQEGGSRTNQTNIARRQQHFEIWIRPVDPKDAVFSIRLAMYLLNRLVKLGVTEEKVGEMRQFLSGYTRLWDLTPARKLGYALDDQFYGIKDYLGGYRSALEKMHAQDVDAAIKRSLVAQPLKIAIIAPDAEALKAKLVSGEPSPKAYPSKVADEVLKMDAEVVSYPLNLTPDQIKVVKADELFVK
jgi:zinc protease